MSEATPAVIIVGLGYGDEGKGSIVDFLTRRRASDLVVRYNGGPQAAHHVVTRDGHHCFAQFGAGTLVAGTQTLLSRFMVIDPPALFAEERALRESGVNDAFDRLFLETECLLVTPFHGMLNRMTELGRGGARHGSCGRGVARAILDAEAGKPAARIADARNPRALRTILEAIREYTLREADELLAHIGPEADNKAMREERDQHRDMEYVAPYAEFCERLFEEARVGLISGAEAALLIKRSSYPIFEGAQGMLLDRRRGFFPYISPGQMDPAPALELIGNRPAFVLGILRAYATRHGAGPFVTEDAELSRLLPDNHNGDGPWQGPVRAGFFDLPAARYALRAAGRVDGIALNCLDRVAGLPSYKLCEAYRFPDEPTARDSAELPWSADASRDEQEQLTARLFRARPVYAETDFHAEPETFAAKLEEKLARRVHIIGLGPAADDKHERIPLGPRDNR